MTETSVKSIGTVFFTVILYVRISPGVISFDKASFLIIPPEFSSDV